MIFIKLYQKCKQLLPSIKSPVTQIKFIRYLSKNISSNFHFRLQSLGATHIPVGRALLREAFIKPSLSRVQDGKNWKNRAVGLQQTQQTHFAGKDGNIVANTNAKKKGEQHQPPWRWKTHWLLEVVFWSLQHLPSWRCGVISQEIHHLQKKRKRFKENG